MPRPRRKAEAGVLPLPSEAGTPSLRQEVVISGICAICSTFLSMELLTALMKITVKQDKSTLV